MPPKTEKGSGDILKVYIQSRNYATKTALSIDFMIIRVTGSKQTSLWLGWSVDHYK